MYWYGPRSRSGLYSCRESRSQQSADETCRNLASIGPEASFPSLRAYWEEACEFARRDFQFLNSFAGLPRSLEPCNLFSSADRRLPGVGRCRSV